MKFFRRNLVLINSIFFLLVVSGLTYTAIAWSNGKTGQTQAGCTCHSAQPSSNTTVTLSSGSGSFTFEPNSETTFTVLVENSSLSKVGMNVGVKTTQTAGNNVGSLTAGTGTKIQDGEVTHNGAQKMSNGKYSFTFDWKAPAEHGEYWIRGVGNAVDGTGGTSSDAWNRFTTQKITVAGVTLASPNGGQDWCVGSTQTIEWDSDGIENVKIEVSTNGGSNWQNVVASTSAASGSYDWAIPNDFTVGSNNIIRISDASKASRNDQSTNSFNISGAVTITSQPQNAETCTGNEFEISVETSGAGNQYQWRKNGQNINGATQSIFSRQSAIPSDAGSYDCKITTSCGEVLTSETATLTVFTSPTVAKQPTNVSGCEGDEITLEAEITGEYSTLQWLKGSQPISGANSMTYVIPSLKASDVGAYKLVATSTKCGNEISTLAANVSLNEPVKFTEQPESISACEGTEVNFTPKISGTASNFQWYRNDEKVSGGVNRDLKITSVDNDNSGEYKLEITGACGDKVTSDVVTLTVNSAPTIASQPKAKEVLEGGNTTLSVVANNPGGDVEDLSYQWLKNGTEISGANDKDYILANVKLTDAGMYSVTITNLCDLAITSDQVEVKVLENKGGPAITIAADFIDFNEVFIGEEKTINAENIITNSGDEALTISAINVNGVDAANFEVLNLTLPLTIQPESSISLEVKFTATKAGLHEAEITFESNAINSASLPVRGLGKSDGTLISSVSNFDFGDVVLEQSKSNQFTISNPTLQDIEITDVVISDDDITIDDIVGQIITPSSEINVQVVFTPTEIRNYDETITIKSDDGKEIVITVKAKAVQSSVEYDISSLLDAKAYPNPSDNSVEFKLNFNAIQSYNISIVNVNGDIIKQISGTSTIGVNTVSWNNRDLNGNKVSAGSYFLLIKVGDRVETVPIIVN